eukprot:2568526-Prymnesium_polylepis.1
MVDGVHFSFTGKSLSVTAAQWRTRATVTSAAPHRGQPRMDVHIQPLYDTTTDSVAPHGLLGQSPPLADSNQHPRLAQIVGVTGLESTRSSAYDGDKLPKHGKRDTYEVLDDGTRTRARRGVGGTVTTRAR